MLWSEGEMTISFPLTKNRSKRTLFERMYYDTFLYVLKGRLRRRLMKSTNKEPNRMPEIVLRYIVLTPQWKLWFARNYL